MEFMANPSTIVRQLKKERRPTAPIIGIECGTWQGKHVGSWFGAQLTHVATFARPTEALNPGQFQLSLDFEFQPPN